VPGPSDDLERPAETMPRAELAALQLSRLPGPRPPCVRAGAVLPRGARPAGCTRSRSARWTTCDASPGRARRICGTTIRSACSRCRATRWSASTRPRERRGSPRSSATPAGIWRSGRRCARVSLRQRGRPGDVFHNAYGYGLFTGGLGMHYGGELLGMTVVRCPAATTSASCC